MSKNKHRGHGVRSEVFFQKENDIHHVYPKETARFNGANAEIEENKQRMPRIIHNKIHALFGNKDPQEQLRMLFEYEQFILSQAVRRCVGKLIDMHPEDFYIERMFKD